MHRLESNRVKDYVLAGNATITLESAMTGKHFTYKITQCKNDSNLYFIKCLRGPDNGNDYTYIGCYYADNKYFYPDKKYKDIDRFSWPKSMQAMSFLLRYLDNPHEKLHVYHNGRCCVCGRMLTTPESIEKGVGPECEKAKVLVTKQEGDYMRELASKGHSQWEIARMTGRSQSCVNYQTSKGSRFKRCDYNRAKYRIDRCGGISMKMVIFRRNGNLYMTNEENYNAIIEDAHKITSLKDFESFDQIVKYMCKYSHAIPEQFIDRTGD